jgi:glycosyltransferase involved in cell wall biosynthesis/tetratricopeptide (TPR) repeat protein
VTIVVLQSGDRRLSRAFLADLAKITDRHDNVLLASPHNITQAAATGNTGEDPWRVKAKDGSFRRVDVVAGRIHPVPNERVVIVDERVIGAGRWIDRLIDLLVKEQVDAVVPRSNFASGDELLVGVPYRPYEQSARNAFLSERNGSSTKPPTSAVRMGGPCVATTLEQLGGRSEFATRLQRPDVADLFARWQADPSRVLIAEDVYLHHPGGSSLVRSRQIGSSGLISACLIVKNEEKSLDRCLSSLHGVVDEIVVYDTGSTDDTVQIARHFTENVVLGSWDDDFARARNEALAHCNGEWILWLDGDEALVCEDPTALRSRLDSLSTDVEGLIVLIDNLRGTEASTPLTHPACRLFRRSIGMWQGALHEQIVARQGTRVMALLDASGLGGLARIRHWGYLQSAMNEKSKGERNLKTAFGDLAGRSELHIADRVLSLGRSHQLAGNGASGIELCRLAAELATTAPTLRMALRGVIEGLTAAERFDEALSYLEPLKLAGATQLASYLGGLAYLAAGEHQDALDLLSEIPVSLDIDGFEYSEAFTAGARAAALAGLERHREAAEVLLSCLSVEGGIDAHLGLLLNSMELAGLDLGDIYDRIGEEKLLAFAPQLLQIQPDTADRCCESWHERAPQSRVVLAVASKVATRLELERQRVWSIRLRAAGLSAACPLIAVAASGTHDQESRLQSATAASVEFHDRRGELLLHVLKDAPVRYFDDGTDAAERRSPHEMQHVLVIARDAVAIDALTAAVLARRRGHEVTLIHPQPIAESFSYLNDLGIGVHGWPEHPEYNWESACLSVVTLIYAAHPIDTVLLMPGAEILADPIVALLPLASVRTAESLDRAPSGAELFSPTSTPVSDRLGFAVATNTRGGATAELDHFAGRVAPELTREFGEEPVVLLGDDPEGRLGRALPLAVSIGPVADPTAWLGRVRLLLIPCSHDAALWITMAAVCGTPALVVPLDETAVQPLIRAVGAMLANDEIWASQIPSQPPSPASAEFALPAPDSRPNRPIDDRREVRIVGDLRSHASLARVNRELAFRLQGRSEFNVTTEARAEWAQGNDTAERLARAHLRPAIPGTTAAIEIRHTWPPDLRPAPGKLVTILPWELGAYPAEWVGPIRDVVDELWVPSSYVRTSATDAGVDPDKIVIVPNGVDTMVYRPDGIKRRLRTRRGTRFLFVGGLIDRKGIDVLLEVYLSNFTSSDDVCLVVKPFGTGSVYDAEVIESTLRRASTSDGPEIEIIDEDLSEQEMAALYRSCTALVHPYRGEGFGLPIAEAMACGLPVIVPSGGASDDFCDKTTGWMIDAVRTPMSVAEFTSTSTGFWWLEPSRIDLARSMRFVTTHADEARRRGTQAHERIREHFTWDHAAEIAAHRLRALLGEINGDVTTSSPAASIGNSRPPLIESNDPADAYELEDGAGLRASIVVTVGPDATATPALDWATSMVAKHRDVELVVVDELPPLAPESPTYLSGERIRVLHTLPIEGSQRARQRGIGLSRGAFVVLTSAEIDPPLDILNRLLEPFADNPRLGAVLALPAIAEQPNVGGDRASPTAFALAASAPLVAISRPALQAIGGHFAVFEGRSDDQSRTGMMLATDVFDRLQSEGWQILDLVDALPSHYVSVQQWVGAPHASQGAQPLWSPPEIVAAPTRGLNIVGLLEAACGIGDAGRRYVEAAEAANEAVATFACNLHSSPEFAFAHRGTGRLDFDTNLFVLNADVFRHFQALAGREISRDRYSVLLPFWELEELSSAFVALKLVDEVWAASEFLTRAYRTQTERPVVTIPLPVRRRDGEPSTSRHDLGLPNGFIFLTTFDFASLAIRKNSVGVISAFCQAFNPGEGPTLVLKTMNGARDANALRRLRERAGRRRDIVVIDQYLDDERMSALVGSADCYVSLHRSEGFGLTLADAMAWGRPVIATNYSGNLDFMTPANSYLVPFEWSTVPDELSWIYPAGAHWAEPSIPQAAQAMRRAWLDRDDSKRRGALGRIDIRRTHGLDVVAKAIVERLDTIEALRSEHRPAKRATPKPPIRATSGAATKTSG